MWLFEWSFAMQVQAPPSFLEQKVMLRRMFFVGIIASLALAHGVVLYKIDSGFRSSDAEPIMVARTHRAYW